jgi:hypothetical protein
MKVKDLIEFLSRCPQDADIVIEKDIDENGFDYLDHIIPGIFELTDYGNDFYPEQGMLLNSAQVRAVCLVAAKTKNPELINTKIKEH